MDEATFQTASEDSSRVLEVRDGRGSSQLYAKSTDTPSCKPDEQLSLFNAEELEECARVAGGKRWR
jgi:hypothetical protein